MTMANMDRDGDDACILFVGPSTKNEEQGDSQICIHNPLPNKPWNEVNEHTRQRTCS